MTQKKRKPHQSDSPVKTDAVTAPAAPQKWGYEEMLTELEAIVSDAEQRFEHEEL